MSYMNVGSSLKVIQNPKSEPSCGYNCVSLLLYAYVQHANMLKYIVYV